MGKEYFRNDFGVVVTDATIDNGQGEIVQIENVNSVQVLRRKLPWLISFLLVTFGGLIISYVFIVIVTSFTQSKFIGIVTLVLSLGAFSYKAFRIFKSPRNKFIVQLQTSSGQIDTFTSYESKGPHAIRDAISEAMSAV
jgi:hypothetical protein